MVPAFIRSRECRDMLDMEVGRRTIPLIAAAWKAEWRLKSEEWTKMANDPRVGMDQEKARKLRQHCLDQSAACLVRAGA